MRSIRRTIALAAALGLSVAIGAAGWMPSSAQTVKAECQASDSGGGPTVQGNISPTDGHTVTTNPARETISGQFKETASPIPGATNQIQVDLTVLECADQVLPSGTSYSTTGQSTNTGVSWPTPPLPWNGPYAVKINATGSNSGARTIVRTFTVVVPPVAPTGVATAPSSKGVTVSWERNSEPDLVGYLVRRAPTSGGFQDVAAVPFAAGTGRISYVDETVTPGDWRYVVIAVRKGATTAETDWQKSTPSSETAANVAAPPATTAPPSSSTSSSGAGSSSTGGGATSSGTGAAASPTPSSTATAKSGTVDLSNFAALLDKGRKTAQAQADALADPGFKDTLPFQPGSGDEPAVSDVPEAGAKAPNQGLGQRTITDNGDRRRALAFVAGAALCFVMFLQVRMIKKEVDRVDLEAAEPGAEPAPAPIALTEPETEQESVALLSPIEMDPEPSPPMIEVLGEPQREPEQPIVIAPAAPMDAPHLDIPEPAASAPKSSTKRSTNAGRTARRVPSRPSNDRGESRAPVRARRGGAGSSDRRVPLG